MVAASVLILVGLLCCLIAFGLPREDGEISRPGLLIPWYVLPMTATAAALRAWPAGARRATVPLIVAVASIAGWVAILMLW